MTFLFEFDAFEVGVVERVGVAAQVGVECGLGTSVPGLFECGC